MIYWIEWRSIVNGPRVEKNIVYCLNKHSYSYQNQHPSIRFPANIRPSQYFLPPNLCWLKTFEHVLFLKTSLITSVKLSLTNFIFPLTISFSVIWKCHLCYVFPYITAVPHGCSHQSFPQLTGADVSSTTRV